MKLNNNFSTTRKLSKLTKEKALDYLKTINFPKDQFETTLFLPINIYRKGEGGLRTKGFYKNRFYQNPLITIITVVYNNERYIEETILSVLNQSYDNIEYLIIDGGSTDKTVEIIKKYNDSIDYWVSEKDKGIYDAMNKGCRLATGVGLCFLNCGDKFIGDVFNNDQKIPFLIPCKITDMKKKNFNRKLSNKKTGMPSSHQAMVFLNKKLLYDLRYKISSDYDYFIRHGSFSEMNSKTSGYVLYNNSGISKKNFFLRDYETISIIFKHYGLISALSFLIKQSLKLFK